MSKAGGESLRQTEPYSEGAETSEAEGETFEGFDGVTADLCKTVGQMNVECVQNVRPPVGSILRQDMKSESFRNPLGVRLHCGWGRS